MASPVDGMLKDGNLEFSGGQDAGKSPSMIDRNQVAAATNATFRNGKAAPRHGFLRRVLNFATPYDSATFRTAMFQHADFFDGTGNPMLISVQGGHLWKIDVRTWKVQEITPWSGRNSALIRQGWSVAAENYWIYQDNQSYPVIFNGAASRRSNPALKEIPVGNIMCYSQGRLIVALPDRMTFRVGDLVFGKTGTTTDILEFTENDYLNEGGDLVARVFGAPSAYGPITCIKAVAMENTQLGQGPVLVGTPNTVFTINLPFDRTTWKNLTSALQTVNPIIGPLGQDSTVLVNSDVWYRALDGIRSYIMAQRDFQAAFANTPQSVEVNVTLEHDDLSLATFGSAVLFDNRLMMTVSPTPSTHGVWHRGLAVIDFNLVSNLRGRSTPCWEGIWTGLKILKIKSCLVDGIPRCFIFSLSDGNEIELWEMIPGRRVDNVDTRIVWTMDLPSYNCGDPFAMKKLETGEIFIDEVSGQVDLNVEYRSDQNPCWSPWRSFSFCATDQDCRVGTPPCSHPRNLKRQFRSKLKLYTPADDFDEINGRKHRTGYEFQPRLEITGACEVKQLRIAALPEPESAHGERRVI
jgi:hypothetical protein